MAATRYNIESIMDGANLKYFSQECANEISWILLFGENKGVVIFLLEGGEYLAIRSLPLAECQKIPAAEFANLIRNLMSRNCKLKLGHYSANEVVTFETALPIEDGELTENQFHRSMAIVLNEINHFNEAAEKMREANYQEADEIDKLFQRLIEPENEK